jgi:hypothetical protein
MSTEMDWADHILAESKTPSDDFTFTDSTNWLQDGYQFDSEENQGVLDGARLPETKGLAQLPDGFVTAFVSTPQEEISLVDEVDGTDFTAFIDETAVEKTASLADLDWLDPTRLQDPDRLPFDDGNSIPELREAWGVDRRTDGIQLVPNRDKEIVEYEQSLKEENVSGLPGSKAARDQVKDAILWAFRRADDGVSVKKIKQGLVDKLGHMATMTRKVVAQIQADRGLAGNVFVHSVAYPDIHRGQTAKKVKAHLRKKKARYVVVPKGEQRLAVWEAIGLKPVTEVPWDYALRQYAPMLESSGYKLASQGDARTKLAKAFRRGPVAAEHVPTVKPKDVRPAERVTVQEALSTFRTAEAVPRQAISNTSKIEEAQRKKVLAQVAKWVKAGHISMKEAHRLARSPVAPQLILRTATMLAKAATAGQSADYQGVGTKYKTRQASMSREAAWSALSNAEAEMDRKARELEASRRQKLGAQLSQMVRKGLLTTDEAAKLAALDKSVDEILKLASAAAQYKRKPKMVASEEREYKGAIVTTAQVQHVPTKKFSAEERRILKASEKSGIKAKEFRSLVKWARIQMSEGAVGNEFDQMLRFRFSKPLLKAAKKILKAVRKEHEGLSGHLYVDAGAYASKKGTKGCEKGALIHRANGLKAVMAIDKCAGCVFRNADSICQKYNKALVDEVPHADPTEYQREAIRLADAPDAEVTASLFATGYDPSEYSLADPLAEISVNEEVETEELGEILWGGMHL